MRLGTANRILAMNVQIGMLLIGLLNRLLRQVILCCMERLILATHRLSTAK